MVLFVYLSAVVPRVVFILHTVLAVWRVTLVKNDPIYWLLLLLILLTLVEMIVTLTVRKGKDYRGFSPALFFYLINIIPPVWMLELYQLEECNSKNSSTKCTNFIPSTEAPATKGHGNSSSTINVVIDFLNSTLDWTLGFHQTLMILLIVGKWILPMGVGISRDQLSQLLLTFVGIAADILEFKSETLSEKGVRCHPDLVYTILALWTWSMLQFPLDLTVLQKPEESHPREVRPKKKEQLHKYSADLWNITISILIQDGPFFTFRLFLMFHQGIVHQMLVFFTIKNALVLTLQIYRLALIYLEMRQSNETQQLTPTEDNVPTSNTEMGDIAE
ncbi:transmembrane protein 26-like isoform X1 [Stegostoma tigrinum]|uniref:transmembrane protein 26-like isoform X1 n=1 Tax=Stegostoma tigrinum TaxID=3053191 RepID=UPI00202AC77A|nr:transmembrane protein 26-like isoform X1 [Stegostoma tigrinum]